MKINLKSIWLWLYIVVMCSGLRALFFVYNLNTGLALDAPLNYQVEQGQSLTRVVNDLEARGLIRSGFDLLMYARLSGQANQMRAGEYALTPELTPLQVLEKLVSGDVVYHQLVLVEGWTVRQALAAVHSNPHLRITLEQSSPAYLQEALGLERHPEGLFFPDTYNFTRGTSDREILLRANRFMDQVLNELWQERDVGLPFDNPYQALIMASIVEKETAVAAERQQIAGVFIRRLQQGMRLQTDPTVIYGLGENFDGDLTRADLRLNTPYNTYMNNGLPPTPIALPGRDAIAASMHPHQGDALYFVARGDGTHQFSSTLQQHNAAVRQYQLNNTTESAE